MEFNTPWRIHWRPGSRVPERRVEAVRRSRPLALALEVSRLDDLDPLGLPWEGTSVVIVLNGWKEEKGIPSPGTADRWEFPVADPVEAGELAGRSFLDVPPALVSMRWFPRHGELGAMLPLLELAGKTGCGLTLPNRPAGVITTQGTGAFPDPAELDDPTAGRLRDAVRDFTPDRLRIHDFILTLTLGLEGAEPRGCEAANSMAFVDEEGKIYPCETLMVPLGDLARDALEDVWASPLRDRVRRDVTSVPGFCTGCPDLPACRAGCRGAVYHLVGHYGAPDPLCRIKQDRSSNE